MSGNVGREDFAQSLCLHCGKEISGKGMNGYCEACVLTRAKLRGRRRCVVPRCENHSDQGEFVGDFCSPCYLYVTEKSRDTHSQACRNEHERAEDRLRRAACGMLVDLLGLGEKVAYSPIADCEILNLLRRDNQDG